MTQGSHTSTSQRSVIIFHIVLYDSNINAAKAFVRKKAANRLTLQPESRPWDSMFTLKGLNEVFIKCAGVEY